MTANAIAQSFTGTGPLQAVARAQIAALRAQARGDVEQYVASLREAALADAQVVHFGPPGLYPGHELLGNALLAIGRHREALEAFQKSLELMPGRSASLLGLASSTRGGRDRGVTKNLREASDKLACRRPGSPGAPGSRPDRQFHDPKGSAGNRVSISRSPERLAGDHAVKLRRRDS